MGDICAKDCPSSPSDTAAATVWILTTTDCSSVLRRYFTMTACHPDGKKKTKIVFRSGLTRPRRHSANYGTSLAVTFFSATPSSVVKGRRCAIGRACTHACLSTQRSQIDGHGG